MGQAKNLDMWKPETGLGQAINCQISHRLPCHDLFAGRSLVICAHAGTVLAVAVPMDSGGLGPLWLPPNPAELLEMGRTHSVASVPSPRCRGWRLKPSEDPILHHSDLLLGPYVLFLTSVLELTRGRNVFEKKVDFCFFKPVLVGCVGFPSCSAGKESACNAGDPGSIPGLGRSPREGLGYPL